MGDVEPQSHDLRRRPSSLRTSPRRPGHREDGRAATLLAPHISPQYMVQTVG